MPPYRVIAIIKENLGEEGYSYKIVLKNNEQMYSTKIIPKDITLNKEGFILFLKQILNVSIEQIIWPDYIVIPD